MQCPNNQSRMDKLLQKLRQNMAELSLQGDDFTRQIWHMYATFEEFIDNQHSPGEAGPVSHKYPGTPPPPPAPGGGFETSRDAVDKRKCRAPLANKTSMSSSALDDLALASPRRNRRRKARKLRRSMDNPLLETISSIGAGDSDEGEFIPSARLFPETDSIGYAGSNSVDSGYKSSCPTPELMDSLYGPGRMEKRGSLASLASSGSSGGSGPNIKPRIAMGTRVMSRAPRSPGTPSPLPKQRPDVTYFELDQLTSYRHSLTGNSPTGTGGLSRFSPRDSPSIDAHISRRPASSPEPCRPRSASTGSRCSSKAPHRTSGSLRTGSPMLASTGSLPRTTSPRPRTLSPAGPPNAWSRHSSPGIMSSSGRRPPSPLVGGPHPEDESELALLEREIDALLYGGGFLDPSEKGTTQFYDLESGQEFPCPFVSSEDPCCSDISSRFRRKTVATEELQSGSSKFCTPPKALRSTFFLSSFPGRNSLSACFPPRHNTPCIDKEDSCCDYHLYEEILYDERRRSLKGCSQETPPPLPKRPPHLFKSPLSEAKLQESSPLEQADAADSSPKPPFQLVTKGKGTIPEAETCTKIPKAPPMPCPRVLSLTSASWEQKRVKPVPPPKPLKRPLPPPKPAPRTSLANRSSQGGSPQVQNTPKEPPVTSRPKLRGNLYSIFTEKDQRKSISDSLVIESLGVEKSASDSKTGKVCQKASEAENGNKNPAKETKTPLKETNIFLRPLPPLPFEKAVAKHSFERIQFFGSTCSPNGVSSYEDEYGFKILPNVV